MYISYYKSQCHGYLVLLTILVYSCPWSSLTRCSLFFLHFSVCVSSLSPLQGLLFLLCLFCTLDLNPLCSILVVQQNHLRVFNNYWWFGLTPNCLKISFWGWSPAICINRKIQVSYSDTLLVGMQNGTTSTVGNLAKYLTKLHRWLPFNPAILLLGIDPWDTHPTIQNTMYKVIHCRIINQCLQKFSLMLFFGKFIVLDITIRSVIHFE